MYFMLGTKVGTSQTSIKDLQNRVSDHKTHLRFEIGHLEAHQSKCPLSNNHKQGDRLDLARNAKTFLKDNYRFPRSFPVSFIERRHEIPWEIFLSRADYYIATSVNTGQLVNFC